MQNKLEIEILKEGLKVQHESLEKNLISKAKYLKSLFEKPDMTEAKMARYKAEEEHVKLCIGFSETAGDVIEVLEKQNHELQIKLDNQRKRVEFLLAEANEYHEKYSKEVLRKFENV